jgi:hypothetical protein
MLLREENSEKKPDTKLKWQRRTDDNRYGKR